MKATYGRWPRPFNVLMLRLKIPRVGVVNARLLNVSFGRTKVDFIRNVKEVFECDSKLKNARELQRDESCLKITDATIS